MYRSYILFLNLLSLSLTIGANYFFNTGVLNGNTMKTIAERYKNYFTPADYAFSIWGVIYLSLIIHLIYSIYLFKNKKKEQSIIDKFGLLFFGSNILNCLWVYFWLTDEIGVCLIILMLLLIVLVRVITSLYNDHKTLTIHNMFIMTPFSIYSGWVCVAFIANAAVFIRKYNLEHYFINETAWTITLLIASAVMFIVTSWKYKTVSFGLTGVWGISAVVFSNFNNQFCISISAILAAIAVLSTCFYVVTTKLQ